MAFGSIGAGQPVNHQALDQSFSKLLALLRDSDAIEALVRQSGLPPAEQNAIVQAIQRGRAGYSEARQRIMKAA